mmetsp:Transcript_2384/g.5634  ORF Transcript_2384/g.5634 Transcript_2384/m.5634 type:complete len:176 (-) Transcript_2384:151-678(-)
MDFIIRGNKTLVAIGVAAIARVVQKFKQMRAKLDESKKALESLEGQVEMLTSKNTAMETQRDEAEGHFFEQLKVLKKEFEDEWTLREQEWQSKLQNKEEDAQQRMDEIASWQTELARLRTEAIAIRSAIEKVRSRSTSPGRSDPDSVSVYSLDKENSVQSVPTNDVHKTISPMRV